MPPKRRPIANLSPSFVTRKQHIVEQISVPTEQYDDLSPKGSIDEGIRDLIAWINGCNGWVTTSSCSGRVSVFVEGQRKAAITKIPDQTVTFLEDAKCERADVKVEVRERKQPREIEQENLQVAEEEQQEVIRASAQDEEDGSGKYHGKNKGRLESTGAGAGGKGGGGKWIFISHDPISLGALGTDVLSFLGMKQLTTELAISRSFTAERLIHFKFEPMILHILTASYLHAQSILSAALQAGFRESGAINLSSNMSEPAMPMVAVRSTGLTLDCIVGRLSAEDEAMSLVSDRYLMGLLELANERFAENSRRIQRFWDLLMAAEKESEAGEWEDAAVRRERKRAEGLEKSLAGKANRE